MAAPETLHVACVQLNAGQDLDDNLAKAADLIRQASARLPSDGPRLIATPEMTSGIIKGSRAQFEAAYTASEHPGIPFFANLAHEVSAHLLVGSMAIRPEADDPDQRLFNRSLLFHPRGAMVASYDKIHMFDVDVAGDQAYRESKAYKPGEDQPVLAALDGVKLGMSICYDVRFPNLYRQLAQAGASVIAVPAAFTVPTGKAHWEVLLRSRAIETGAYVIAPAQTGEHYPGRATYGHSMIISPWGQVLQAAGDQPGVITASLDLAAVAKARAAIPAWQH